MKTRNSVVVVLFFVSISALAQTKYGVEFVGGMNCGLLNLDQTKHSPYAYTGGVGVVVHATREVEFVGSTLFTYFPPSARTSLPVYRESFIPYPFPIYPADRKAYSFELIFGPRFNGHGSAAIHPFLVLQGGMQILRIVEGAEYFAMPALDDRQASATTQFLNLPGTEDIQLRGLINIGGGVQLIPSQSLRLNLQVSYRLMIGRESSVDSFVPVTLSVLLPV